MNRILIFFTAAVLSATMLIFAQGADDAEGRPHIYADAIADVSTDDDTNVNTDDSAEAGIAETPAAPAAEEKAARAPAADSDLSMERFRAKADGGAEQPEPGETPTPAEPAVRPKVAVYVTGGKDVAENKALATYILDAIAASNRYTAIERSEMFLAEIDNEQVKQRSGAIDDSQISELGRQSGVRYVCVADITAALRGYQISARILDVETAEITTVGVTQSPLKTMDDLRKASADVVTAMLRKLYPDDYKDVPLPEKRMKLGIRAACNGAFVSNSDFKVEHYEPTEESDYRTEVFSSRPGLGVEISIGAHIGVSETMWFSLYPGFIIRSPSVTKVSSASEMAFSVPALIEWKVSGSQVHALCGIHIEAPFNSKTNWKDDNTPDYIVSRSIADFGLVAGAAYYMKRNAAIDLRGSVGLSQFDGEKGRHLFQLSLGISYQY